MKDNFFWAVDGSPYRSEFLVGTRVFGSKEPIYLIDQYSGKRPALINEEFLKGGTISFSMYPSALLDSNVVDVLDKFVVKGGVTDGWSEFLSFLTRRRWDFSAHFYYLEHFAKSPLQDFLPNAIRRTKSLLTLFSMDEDFYLKTGRVRANPEAVSHHLKEGGGGDSVDEIAENRVASFIEGHDRHVLREMLDSVESCLIKMILIKRFEMKAAPASEQYGEFVRFMQQDLGISLARENHFAMHYFAGRGGRLLGVQSNTSYSKAISIVKSTAWDMYLLRMPEIFFSKLSGELCIPYVATQEKRLHELARQFSIERIENFSGIGFSPKIGFKMDEYLEGLYSDVPGLLGEARGGIRHVPVGLVEALNRQLAFYCP